MTDELNDFEQDSDYDGAWKEAARGHFAEFVAVYFPATFVEVDWSIEPEWLDKEISQILGESGQRNRVVDLLVKVRLLNGDEQRILLHIEIQTGYEVGHAERLALYNAGLMWTFQRPVVTLSVLADLRPNWLPNEHSFRCGDFSVGWKFSVCKLLHHLDADWKSDTRLPVVLARAQIAALRTASDPEKRLSAKWQLVRGLYESGYSASQVRELFRLIDWMMHLRRDLEDQFKRQVVAFEEEQTMPYVTSIERLAKEEGQVATILGFVSRRCGAAPVDYTRRLRGLAPEDREALLYESPHFQSWPEFESRLNAVAQGIDSEV